MSVRLLPLAVLLTLTTGARAQTWTTEIQHPPVIPTTQALAVAGDGSLHVSGSSLVTGSVIHRVDAEGTVLGSFTLAAFSGHPVNVLDMVAGAPGEIVVCARIDRRPWLASLDAVTGLPSWEHTLHDGSLDLSNVERMADGGFLAVGTDGSPLDAVAVRTDANGVLLWQRNFGFGASADGHRACAPTPDGGALLLAFVAAVLPTPARAFLSRIDASGSTQWRHLIEFEDDFAPLTLALAADGGAFLAGRYGSTTDPAIGVVRVDAVGFVVWARAFQGPPAGGLVVDTLGVVATEGGGAAVLALQPIPYAIPDRDACLLRLDANGNVLAYENHGVPGASEGTGTLAPTADGGFVLAIRVGDDTRLVRLDRRARAGGSCGAPPPVAVLSEDLTGTVTASKLKFGPLDPATNAETVTPVPFVASASRTCENLCRALGAAYGNGLAGSGGLVPDLGIDDGWCTGSGPVIHVDSALGAAPAFLGLSLAPASVPLLGGTLLVDPGGLQTMAIPLGGTPGVAGTGSFSVQATGDLSSLAGTTLFLQAAVRDDGAIRGWALSNGASMQMQ